MKIHHPMLDKIIEFAKHDKKVRAVILNGSRVNQNCFCDSLSDYDIQCIISNIAPFLSNKEWIKSFGELLIMQEPDNWYNHPYDLSKKEPYTFLMQFVDGNRMDLTLIDMHNMQKVNNEKEPRKILLNKDRSPELNDIDQSDCYSITLPSQKEYSDTIDEFLWLSLYVAKGIIRNELCYAKYFMDHHEIDLICKMLSWKIGTDNSYPMSLGKTCKYLKRYLSESEMNAFALLYSNGDFCEIRGKLLYSLDYFKAISIYVAEKMNYNVDIDQMNKVKEYVENLNLKIA